MKTMKMWFQPSRAGGLLIPALALAIAAIFTGAARGGNRPGTSFEQRRNLSAVQTIYRRGVPQLTKHGQVLMKYDPKRSFLPVGMWGVPLPDKAYYGHRYDWSVLKRAGFNTVWVWYVPTIPAVKAAARFGLQVILDGPKSPKVLRLIRNSPNLLGDVWMDEPIGQLGAPGVDMARIFRAFMDYKKMAQSIDPNLVVFVNDGADVVPQATKDWWIKWNNAGDISCDDVYPNQAPSLGEEPNGIPQMVSLEVRSSHERKPAWLIVGALEQVHPRGNGFALRFATPTQLRAEVYAGIISGATGITYFIWDSFISRDVSLVGMSPDPQVDMGGTKPTPATPMQLVQSRALWGAATVINRELARLAPVILSPTVGPEVDYKVAISGRSRTVAPIRCMLKPDPRGGYVLLTVNIDDAVLRVNYTFPKPLREVATMFDHWPPRKFHPPVETFSVRYEPFETHVFRVIPAATSPPGGRATPNKR